MLIKIKSKEQLIKCFEDQKERAKSNPSYEAHGVTYGFTEDYLRGAIDSLNVAIELVKHSELG